MQPNRNLLSLVNLFRVAGLPGYLFFFRNILLFSTFRRRDLDEYSNVDSSAMLQIIFVFGVFFISLYLLYKSPQKRRFLFSRPQVFLLIYTLICFLSILWTPNFKITGYRAFESLAYLLLISLIAYNLITRIGHQDIIEWAILWIIWDIFWSIATNFKMHGIGFDFGIFRASRLAVPMFFFFALLLTQRIYFKYIILAFAILMVSNKVFFGITLGLFGFYFGNLKYKGWLLLFAISVIVALLLVDVNQLLLDTLFYGRETASMASTSGRDQIWRISWEAFKQRPILGYGFVEGESEILFSKFSGAISTHNFFLSGLLGTGIVGASFLVLYFAGTFLKAASIYFPVNKVRPAMVSTFIMSLVVSLTAPGVGGRVYGSWISVVLIFTLISALQFKFEINNKIRKITKHENNLGNTQFSGLSHSDI